MSADRKLVKPGAIVWLLDRRRVREGLGPSQIKLTSVSSMGWCSVFGNRGTYHVSDLHETEAAARAAWAERAQAEMAVELARHNKIMAKLQRGLG